MAKKAPYDPLNCNRPPSSIKDGTSQTSATPASARGLRERVTVAPNAKQAGSPRLQLLQIGRSASAGTGASVLQLRHHDSGCPRGAALRSERRLCKFVRLPVECPCPH